MSLKSGKIVLIWTLSLFLASLCLGWLPLFSLVQKYFLNTGTDMVFGGKTYSSDTDAEPIVVLRGNRHISDYVDLKLRFRVKEFSEYANAFQTAPGNEGLRLELSSTPQGTIQSGVVYLLDGKVRGLTINRDIEIGKEYTLELKTVHTGLMYVYFDEEFVGTIQFDYLVISDFLLGTGFDSTRRFKGDVDLEHGKVKFLHPIEDAYWWLEHYSILKIFRFIGYLFLFINLLAFLKIFEFIYYGNNWSSNINIEEKLSEFFLIKRIKIYNERIFEKIDKSPEALFLVLFKIQIVIALFAMAKYSWEIGDIINESSRALWGYRLYEWTNIFYHPFAGNIFNYIILCVLTGLYGLAIYIFINRINAKIIRNSSTRQKYLQLCIFVISLILLPNKSILKYQPALRYFLIALFPILYVFSVKYKESLYKWIHLLSPKTLFLKMVSYENLQDKINTMQSEVNMLNKAINFDVFTKKKLILVTLILLLLFIVSLEPLNIIKGPIYLINEYDMFGETYLKGVLVHNKVFLNNLQDDEKNWIDAIWTMEPTDKIRLSTIFSNWLPSGHSTMLLTRENQITSETLTINPDTIKDFYLKNYYAYSHYQNFSRGQINHIGHVLNPINELQLGKPLKEIYLQYGLGYTFLLKWTMDLFGGVSIENYYKCYIYYINYFILFLIMVYVIFRNSLYAAVAFSVLCYAYFYQQFNAFILAPGIIPAIHFFDIFVVTFLVLFFRRTSFLYLIFAVISALAGIIINRQFGTILSVALIVSMLMYALEQKHNKEKYRGLAIVVAIMSLTVITLRFTASGTLEGTFPYFVTGLFSWPANLRIISWTILYFAISYLFLLMLKDYRHYLKYVYVVTFIYTQGLFVYYYWSGLSNHLPTVLPFLGVQICLMIFISQNILFADKDRVRRIMGIVLNVALVVLVLYTMDNAVIFYQQKALFVKNFADHKVYSWNIERARIVTTIDPKPVEESVSLIRKYSAHEKGIFILSKYDNLLPYLAERYSKMPYFEMTWHLLSKKESGEAIERIRNYKPKFLFFDTNLTDEIYDPWSKLYYVSWQRQERDSRIGRYRELQKVFNAVSHEYELVEKGFLISVYKRKSRSHSHKHEILFNRNMTFNPRNT